MRTLKIVRGILLSVYIISQNIMATGYSNLDHPQSDEIFSKNVITQKEYDNLLEDMRTVQTDLKSSSPSSKLRDNLIDLYARLSILIEQTKVKNISDTRGEDFLEQLESYMRQFIIKNPAPHNTISEFRKEAQERKNTILKIEEKTKNHVKRGLTEKMANTSK